MSDHAIALILLLVCCTSFVKVLTTLSIFRIGLGLSGISFGVVTLILSVVLAWFVVSPIVGGSPPSFQETPPSIATFRPFLQRNIDNEVLAQLQTIRATQSDVPKTKPSPTMEVQTADPSPPVDTTLQPSDDDALLVTGFLLSELRRAFKLGLLFLLPFVVIDLFVVNILAVLGVQSVSAWMIGLPLKLMLFIALDGWGIFVSRVLSTAGQ